MRRLDILTAEDLGALPDRCQRCLFWELGGPRPADREVRPERSGDDDMVRKAAWWRSVELDSGPAGRVIRVDGEPAGWCLLLPAGASTAVRNGGALPTAPTPSFDALLLATVWVEPAFRGQRLGRLLVQHVVKEAVRRDLKAVEAYGDRRHREGGCLLPCTWLLHEGFAVRREHPRVPLLRLDVRTVARFAEPFEHALEAARARLVRGPAPEPVPQGPLSPIRRGDAP